MKVRSFKAKLAYLLVAAMSVGTMQYMIPNVNYAATQEVTTKEMSTNERIVEESAVSATYAAKAAKITANPKGGAVEKGTYVRLSATTQGAIRVKVVAPDQNISNIALEDYEAYDQEQGVRIDDAATVAAYVKNGDYQSNLFKFNYTLLSEKSIADVRNQGTGKAKFKGVVTRISSSGFYVDDGTAGMYVYGTPKGGINFRVGDEVRVEGSVTKYNQLLEVESGATVTPTGNQKEVTPIEVTMEAYVQAPDQYESRLIQFKEVALGKVNTSGNTPITKNGTSANIYKICEGVKTGYDTYDVTAIGARYNKNYQLVVTGPDDITPVSGIEALPDVAVKLGENFTLPQEIEVVENRIRTKKKITWDEADVAKVNPNVKGSYLVKGVAEGTLVSVKVDVIADEQVKIADIQGKGHVSPYENKNVADLVGIVTALNGTKGFYMQDMVPDGDDDTSDGIYVYKSNHHVKVGDVVTVSGKVEEYASDATYLSITELKASDIKVTESNHALPAPVIIGKNGRVLPSAVIDNDGFATYDPSEDGIDFFESIEGMYVEIQDPLVTGAKYSNTIPVVPDKGALSEGLVSPQGGVVLSENNSHAEVITLAKGMNTNLPDVVTGDQFDGNVFGVVDYYNGNYCVRTSEALPEVIQHTYNSDPVTSIQQTPNGLRIASFNVENMGGDASEDKMNGVTKAIVNHLGCPDIVTLEEIQDNSGANNDGIVAADVTFSRIVEGISKLTNHSINYQYIQISPEDGKDGGAPGGNIRIGMLYNPERVQLAPGQAGDATTAVGVTKATNGTPDLTLNPGRIDPSNPYFESTRKSLAAEFIFNGQKVFVIGNHLSSKGGDQPLFGSHQPPVLSSEVKRIEQAKAVNGFVKQLLAVDPQAKIVVLGDLNDFYFSKPVKQVAGDELSNLLYNLPENKRFTYVYGGRSQVLDNVLITKGLEAYTDIEVLNMNSIKPSNEQLSDHDPIVIRLNMDQIPKQPAQNSNHDASSNGSSSSSSSASSSGSSSSSSSRSSSSNTSSSTPNHDASKASNKVSDQINQAIDQKEAVILKTDSNGKLQLDAKSNQILLEKHQPVTIQTDQMSLTFNKQNLEEWQAQDKVLDVKVSQVGQEVTKKLAESSLPQPISGLSEVTISVDQKAASFKEPVICQMDLSKAIYKEAKHLSLVRYDLQADGSYQVVPLGGTLNSAKNGLTAYIDQEGIYGVAEIPGLKKAELVIGSQEMKVNGEAKSCEVAPVIVAGKTMVPLRVISECLDGKVEWKNQTKTVVVTINGETKTFSKAEGTIIKQNRTLVPLRSISEAFGAHVIWSSAQQMIEIVKA